MSTMDTAVASSIRRDETVRVALLLAFAGGYLDAYTWIIHGVMANAQTANLVLLWAHGTAGEWARAAHFFLRLPRSRWASSLPNGCVASPETGPARSARSSRSCCWSRSESYTTDCGVWQARLEFRSSRRCKPRSSPASRAWCTAP